MMHSDRGSTVFDYDKAFCRNIGWLSFSEQTLLRCKKIAIAGMGGVGGVHLLTLVRLGIEHFHIADLDHFELQNFNRQIGANTSTLDQSKVDVLAAMAREINPLVEIKPFNQGINKSNFEEFLDGVHLYIDGLDFFALEEREEVFNLCFTKNIPIITAAPLGMSTAYLIGLPGKMSFNDYFNFTKATPENKKYHFLIGLNPKMNNRHYLVDKNAVNFNLEKGPSTTMACSLSSGVMGTEALKILLNRGKVYPVPYYHIFDAYLNKHVVGWMPWGNRNPIQKLKIHIMKKIIARYEHESILKPLAPADELDQILEMARWAPSGDNDQPWRFTRISENEVDIYLTNGIDSNLYDFAGLPTLISMGCLLETLKLAATKYHKTITWTQEKKDKNTHLFTVKFLTDESIKINPLSNAILERSVNRSAYKSLKLDDAAKNTLRKAIGEDFDLLWFETQGDKWKIAKINAIATKIRMKAPELFSVHQHAFKTKDSNPTTGIPLVATGLNLLSQKMMSWGLRNPKYMHLLLRLGAVKSSQLELDYLPGIFCGAQFMLLSKKTFDEETAVRMGIKLQRFWLTSTQMGLCMQPSFSPLIFSYYIRNSIEFTSDKSLYEPARQLTQELDKIAPDKNIVFIGRIGYPARAKSSSRSERLSLQELLSNG